MSQTDAWANHKEIIYTILHLIIRSAGLLFWVRRFTSIWTLEVLSKENHDADPPIYELKPSSYWPSAIVLCKWHTWLIKPPNKKAKFRARRLYFSKKSSFQLSIPRNERVVKAARAFLHWHRAHFPQICLSKCQQTHHPPPTSHTTTHGSPLVSARPFFLEREREISHIYFLMCVRASDDKSRAPKIKQTGSRCIGHRTPRDIIEMTIWVVLADRSLVRLIVIERPVAFCVPWRRLLAPFCAAKRHVVINQTDDFGGVRWMHFTSDSSCCFLWSWSFRADDTNIPGPEFLQNFSHTSQILNF